MSERTGEYIRQHHLALLTLFIVVTGGTAWANHGNPNSIDSADVIDNSLSHLDLQNNNVRSADIRNDNLVGGGLVGADIAANSLGAADIADTSSLGGGEIDEASLFNDDSLAANDLAVGSVGSSEIANGSIITADINTAAVSLGGDLSGSTLGNAQIFEGVVRSPEVDDDSLTNNDLAPAAVGTSEVANQALTGADVADTSSIGGLEINENALVVGGDLSGTVASAGIRAGTVASGEVVDNSLTGNDIDEANVNGLLRCPTPATVRIDRLCAGSPDAAKTWEAAIDFCASLDLRLPTVGEAFTLAIRHNVPGVTTGEEFWTDNFHINAQDFFASVTVDEAGNLDFARLSFPQETVCVTTPFN